MIIDANSIREGNILEYKDKLWLVLSRQHVKPGKGGAFVQVELKDIINGTKMNERFRSDETVAKARIEDIQYQFLFREGDIFTLMHLENYEQEQFSVDLFMGKENLLQDEMIVKVGFHDTKPIWINLPEQIICEVIECEPSIKGQTAASSYKPAILDNKSRIMVPPFIETGEKIVVRTEDLTYIERLKTSK